MENHDHLHPKRTWQLFMRKKRKFTRLYTIDIKGRPKDCIKSNKEKIYRRTFLYFYSFTFLFLFLFSFISFARQRNGKYLWRKCMVVAWENLKSCYKISGTNHRNPILVGQLDIPIHVILFISIPSYSKIGSNISFLY